LGNTPTAVPQTEHPAYRLAFQDADFLLREDLRPVRFQLELMKPEVLLAEADIHSTFVFYGSARIPSPEEAPALIAAAETPERKAVAARVFSDAEQRKLLNGIVHPRVAELSRERFAEHAARGDELIGYEVPLLFENGLEAVFRPVVLVALKPEQQQQRLMTRDGLDQEAAQARLAAQWPLERKLAGADFVLWNEGSLAELQAALEALIPRLRAFSMDGT
jgi:dephospho-CoA kinase